MTPLLNDPFPLRFVFSQDTIKKGKGQWSKTPTENSLALLGQHFQLHAVLKISPEK
jgi:hypothetical protein